MRRAAKDLIAAGTAALLLASAPAWASGPKPGCYAREYSSAHLSGHPRQIVRSMRLHVFDDAGETYARMRVGLARQGHVAKSGHGGQTLETFLVCWRENGPATCAVECDGGHFEVTREDGKVLTFRTDYMMVGDTGECGGAVDLAEVPRQPVSYRLNRVPAAECEGF